MKLYKLECLTEDGQVENNGYYANIESAEIKKKYLDSDRRNEKYGIKQTIIEIEVKDITTRVPDNTCLIPNCRKLNSAKSALCKDHR